MKESLKNTLSLIGRFGLSAALMWWVLSKVDLKHMAEALQGADYGLMFVAFLVVVLTTLIILWRWRILMKSVGLKVGYYHTFRWFFIGQFCNLFLPTSIGGDVVKGIGLANVIGNKPKVFASIVLDRLTGFIGIVLTSVLAFSFGRSIVNDQTVVLSIAAMTVFSVTLAMVLMSQRIFTTLCKVFGFLPKVKNALLRLHDDVILLRSQQRRGLYSIALSVLAQLVLAFAFYITSLAMHQDVNLVYFIIFSPLVCVATALPSIGGLGVREIGWVYLLSKVGVHEGVALGLSLMNFGFTVVIGIFGGLLYVLTLSHRRV